MNDTASHRLQVLCADYWSTYLEQFPSHATALSVHDHDDRLEDLSPEALEALLERTREFKARLDAIPAAELSEREGVTRAMLEEALVSMLIGGSDGVEEWSVDQLGGPQVSLLDLVRVHDITDARSMGTWLARVPAMGPLVDQHVANLRRGLAKGKVASLPTVDRVLEQLEDQIVAGPGGSPLVTVPGARKPPGVADGAWAQFLGEVESTVAAGLLPAFARYRDFLRDDIRPQARQIPGLVSQIDGKTLYAHAIRLNLAMDMSPQDLHETGLAEVARIREGMTAICKDLFPGMALPEAFVALRTDPRCLFTSREEIVEVARTAVHRATDAAKACFDLLPDHECDVKPVDAHAEKSSAAAFYMQPAPDGSRRGTYYVNTCDPTARTRHEAEAVAFHEAVPGHHLQIALAQKIDAPEFQKHRHDTAYVEGWALYTEALADELKLYTGPIDRLGMLSCDALRACRLVVDTGLHAFGWSRERAIQYMAENTAGSLNDIRNEVDRYIAWPGQALSYKTGQLEIQKLRKTAEAQLGKKFRLAGFHAAVLEHGGVTLPILRDAIERYIAREK